MAGKGGLLLGSTKFVFKRFIAVLKCFSRLGFTCSRIAAIESLVRFGRNRCIRALIHTTVAAKRCVASKMIRYDGDFKPWSGASNLLFRVLARLRLVWTGAPSCARRR